METSLLMLFIASILEPALEKYFHLYHKVHSMTGSNAILSSQTRTGTFLVAITIIICRLIIVRLQVETRGQPGTEVWLIIYASESSQSQVSSCYPCYHLFMLCHRIYQQDKAL